MKSGNRIRDQTKEEKAMLKKIIAGITVIMLAFASVSAGAVNNQPPDYSQDANPAIFTGNLTREFYNSARHAYLHSAEMAAAYDPNQYKADEMFSIFLPAGAAITEEMQDVCRCIGGVAYNFTITDANPYVYAFPRSDADLEKPSVRAIIEEAKAKGSDRKKAEYLANSICDRLEYAYNEKPTSWSTALDGSGKVICSGYASAFRRMGRAAGLLTFSAVSRAADHTWNVVYCDGEWLTVDLTHYDSSRKEVYWFQQKHPKMTPDYEANLRFAQEVMMPNSTK